MRSWILVSLFLIGCHASIEGGPDSTPMSMRERLASETRLLLLAPSSSGVVTAERWTHDGWHAGDVDLLIDTGEIVAEADDAGAITIARLGLGLKPIDLPEEVFEKPARMVNVRVELIEPVRSRDVVWGGDDAATVTLELDLVMSWALEVGGSPTPLGMPKLPPVPVTLALTGDGTTVRGALFAEAAGELWSWADLVKLHDLQLVLAAETP
jgi:hypothetical protein